MAEASSVPSEPAKPGTACLGCRRRKLKCSREKEGCSNCTKLELPCVYSTAEAGVKRKRGPYKKDKPARERHLDDLVRYLEPKSSSADVSRLDEPSPSSSGTPSGSTGAHQNGRPEELVKDALIVLTKSSATERESNSESYGTRLTNREGYLTPELRISSGLQPPARRVFEYWHLFVTRVDPLTKILHCSTFAEKLFLAIDDLDKAETTTQTLLFSIYYAAVSTCTTNEARGRFGESKDTLLKQYGRIIETALTENYGMPTLESVQALVIYIICIRRQDDGTNVRTLFGLAVRLAQMIRLHEDPGPGVRVLEAELRRRVWWHICGLESRGAEEGGTRTTSVMQGCNVQFPMNLNDYDLDSRMTEVPPQRVGVTDMTFPRIRWDILRTVFSIWSIRKSNEAMGSQSSLDSIKVEQNRLFEEARARLIVEYRDHLHPSRPYDWMSMKFLDGMLIKTQMIIDNHFGQIPTKDMNAEKHFRQLQSSVDIISDTHALATDQRVESWMWFFRGYVQWHSLAIVVAELGRSTNPQFTRTAWAVLDPILAGWDKTYRPKRGEPAWDHVNTLIERARKVREQNAEQAVGHSQLAAEQPPGLDAPHATGVTASSIPYDASDIGRSSNITSEPPQKAIDLTMQQALTPHSLHDRSSAIPATHSCALTALDFNNDFGSWGGSDQFDQIDFSAFDAVFGGPGWEIPSPFAELESGFS